MSTQEIDLAIADFVAHNTAAAEIFEDLGIDYCCGGRQTLRQACSARGLDLELVLGRLREAAAALADRSTEPAAMSLTGLIDDILETHHRYLAHALARINSLFNRVCAAHHDNHPELKQSVLVFEGLRTELEAHMFKEEQILFPLIKRIEAGEAPGLAAAGPIQVMESEHSSAGSALAELRTLTNGYTVPEDGCTSYHLLVNLLEEFEKNTHLHIHKENNILFPRALIAG